MPSFCFTSSIRVASQDHALRLKITHNLVHGLPSDTVHSVKGRLPKELDVLWLSDLTLSLSGSVDGHQISAPDIAHSGLVHHLQMYLKANADRIGLNNVSRPFVDDADGLSKLTLTPSRPLPHASRPHANLVSLHLAYIWRTVVGRSDTIDSGHRAEELNPFSPTLFLPAEALLNRATDQFLINHLVGRYPLVFGPWCKRLDLEMQYFPSIGHSIKEIITRSQNRWFLSKCRRLLKIAHSHHNFVLQTCATALPSCTDDAASDSSEREIDNTPAMPALTDEQVLCESMEQLFRVGVPQRRFKPATTPQFAPLAQDDDDGLLPWIPDARIDDEAPWVELPEIATSPCTFEADPCQTLPEEMDVFTKEDWTEDGTWCLNGADTNPDDCELDALSDESLISASFPSASITTLSPQACPFTLYHHLDVDCHKPDPAVSGMGYHTSELAFLEDSGTSVMFANHSQSHAHQKNAQLTQESGTCPVDSESFETLDSPCEVEDSDSILSGLDGDIDMLLLSPNATDLTAFDANIDLEWDDH